MVLEEGPSYRTEAESIDGVCLTFHEITVKAGGYRE
jgi:hypothetical protein